MSNLRIDDEEDTVLDLDTINPSTENPVALLLLGRLLTERSFNVDAFKRTITNVWDPIHGLVIRVISPNLFAFQFYHWRDMLKVLDGRPWCFDNMLILLKEADGHEQPDKVTLNYSPFWVRIKNLPFNNRSNEVVRALVGNMGEVLDIEEDVLGFGKYRRVKVMLDVSRPLRRYRKMKDKWGREFQVDFAYERLPFFCFACGVMGHSEKDCHVVPEEDKLEKMGWSLALKATPRKGRTKELEEEQKFKSCKKILFESNSIQKSVEEKSEKFSLMATINATPAPILEKQPHIAPSSVEEDTFSIMPSVKTFKASIDDVVSAPFINPLPVLSKGSTETITATASSFVFEATNKVGPRHWKRMARGELVDKGSTQDMDMDPADKDKKRLLDDGVLVCTDDDGATKRAKLSPPHENSSFSLAEVGLTQPRLAL